jgi:hypothetical protein
MKGKALRPARQLAEFIAKYDPEVARVARFARSRLRKLLPASALELVYDNYNALAFGYGPTERASDVVVSVALYRRWVSLFFMQGARLADPSRVLRGSGSRVRHIVLAPPEILNSVPVRVLIKAAVAKHPKRFGPGRGRTIIKSVSTKQRPRRPGARVSRPTSG